MKISSYNSTYKLSRYLVFLRSTRIPLLDFNLQMLFISVRKKDLVNNLKSYSYKDGLNT